VSDLWARTIAHADMDAFYAAIEQLDDPTLRGKPVIVGPKSSRGVVLTASYEARPYRVGSAMPMAVARQRCPEAIVVPPRFDRYREVSLQVMKAFHDFSPYVEAISLDEAFLDMTGAGQLLGAPERWGPRLKNAVREATNGLTVSVGISTTKYVAKVASGYVKPDGLTIVPPDQAIEWLAPKPVAALWGAGPKAQQRLDELGLKTIGDVTRFGAAQLEAALGKLGRHFYELAHARDPRSVHGSRPAKSVSSERTLTVDVDSMAQIRLYVRQAASVVARRLRNKAETACGVRVKLKTHDFRILTRQRQLRRASSSTDVIYRTAEALLRDFDDPGPFRLVGVAAFDIRAPGTAQLDLIDDSSAKAKRLDEVLDRVEQRFGPGAVQRAGELLNRTVFDEHPNPDYLIPDRRDPDEPQ
jgi:DNA polymerase-4